MERLFLMCSLCAAVALCQGIVSSSENKEEVANQVAASDKLERKLGFLGDYNHGQYHSGGDYGYGGGGVYDHHEYKGHDAALKTLLVPLAGVALLGAAALFASNPVLLQLGVITGKRKRRDITGLFESEKFRDIQTLEKFIDQLPKQQVLKQDKKLLASYVQCSGAFGPSDRCFERLSCEMHHPKANLTYLDQHVFNIVTSDIMRNEFVPDELKIRIAKAKTVGASSGSCETFYCSEIDK